MGNSLKITIYITKKYAMNKYLLVLGFREGFIDAAEKLNLQVAFVVEKLKSGLEEYPYIKVSNLSNYDEVYRAAQSMGLEFCGVVTGHEQAVISATLLRKELSLPGPSDFSQVVRCRDKFVQKSSLSSNIAKASCKYINTSLPDYSNIFAEFGPGFIVKPSAAHGSQGTTRIHNETEWNDFVKNTCIDSDVNYMVESFIEGKELHVDGIVSKGNIIWSATTRYLGNLMNWSKGGLAGDIVLGGRIPHLENAAENLSKKILAELEIPDGVFHLELFEKSNGDLVFGEVACRLAGTLIPEILYRTYGINLYSAAIHAALGMEFPLDSIYEDISEVFGYVFLPYRDKVTADKLSNIAPLFEISYPLKDEGRKGSYAHWGHAIGSANTPAELENKFLALSNYCAVSS